MSKTMNLKYIYGDTAYGYRINDTCESVFRPFGLPLTNVQFEGFDGWESARTVKDAVDLMLVDNPAKTFAQKMKGGAYENAPEACVAREAQVVNILSELWKYPNDKNTNAPTLNVMMLLANALTLIAQNVEYFDDYFKQQNGLYECDELDFIKKEDNNNE